MQSLIYEHHFALLSSDIYFCLCRKSNIFDSKLRKIQILDFVQYSIDLLLLLLYKIAARNFKQMIN